MKKYIILLVAAILSLSSCGLQPDPSWAPSPKPSVELRTLEDVIYPNR